MSDMPWFRFFPSDWLGGTRGLTSSETGIYITLIAMMYERDGWLDANHSRLARLCGASNSAFSKAIETLLSDEKIIEKEGAYSNERVLEELSYRSKKETLARRAAKSRWQEKSTKSKGGAKRPHSVGNAIPEARGHIPDNKVKEDTDVSSKKRASRLPEDWELPVDFREWCHEEWPGIRDQFIASQADRFRDYWVSKAGRDAAKVNWLATWRNWMRRAVEEAGRKSSQQRQREPKGGDVFFAAAEFLRNEPTGHGAGVTGDWGHDESLPLVISDNSRNR